MNKTLIIVPTFNEAENIQSLVHCVMGIDASYSLLVVDDNSPDGTKDLVGNLQKKYPQRLFLEVREKKTGLGAAYVHGFQWAIKHNYEFIVEMDADFSHNPYDIQKLLAPLQNDQADFSVGSRYKKGIQVVNWPLNRIILSISASFYVRLITCLPIRDTTAGFVAYRREVLASIDLHNIRFNGYAFQVEMKFKAWKKGFRFIEIPITFKDREHGTSKMNMSIVNEAIFGIVAMKIKSMRNKL